MIPGLNRVGGAEQQTILLARGLAQRGWRVTVLVLSGDQGTATTLLESRGVQFLSLKMRKGLADPRGWLLLHSWLRRERPEIVHAHLPHAAWMARWSRLGAPVRVLIDTLHSSSTGTAGRQIGYRISDWLTDKVTAVSSAVADTHLAARMVSAGKLVVLANGINLDQWHRDADARVSLRTEIGMDSGFLWFAASRLDAVKDYPTLLTALALTPEDEYLAIAGSGPQETKLRQMTRDLKLEKRVRFLGFEPDVRRWMQAADGFVLCSRWEGLPMGLLEAAACELPVVATDVPGTREVVMHGVTGFLSPAGNPYGLSNSMIRMVQMTASARAQMGANARQLVVERFGLDAALDLWETIYRELLSRNQFPHRRAL
jgi:glycosyltransferase involved in cell wall biosynthesis